MADPDYSIASKVFVPKPRDPLETLQGLERWGILKNQNKITGLEAQQKQVDVNSLADWRNTRSAESLVGATPDLREGALRGDTTREGLKKDVMSRDANYILNERNPEIRKYLWQRKGEEYVRNGWVPADVWDKIRDNPNDQVLTNIARGNIGVPEWRETTGQHAEASAAGQAPYHYHNAAPGEVVRRVSPLPAGGSPVGQLQNPGSTDRSSNAISGIESGGRYDALGPVLIKGDYAGDRAYGKYQVMGNNIGPWSEEVLGRRMSPQEFLRDPQAQEAVFKAKFGQLEQKYGPEGAARAWFAGEGGMNDLGRKDQLGTTVGQYGQRFAQNYGPGVTASDAGNAGPPTTPPNVNEYSKEVPKVEVGTPMPTGPDVVQSGIDPQFAQAKNEGFKKFNDQIAPMAAESAKNQATLGSMESELRSGRVTTDRLAELKTAIAGFLYGATKDMDAVKGILGTNLPAQEVLNKDTTRMGLTFARQTEGAREAVAAIQIALGANPSLLNSEAGNLKVIEIMKRSNEYDQEMSKAAEAYMARNHHLNGFENWWLDKHPPANFISKAVPYQLPPKPSELKNGVTYEFPTGNTKNDGTPETQKGTWNAESKHFDAVK